MGDESLCDVIFVGSDGSKTYTEYPDRPIVKLFERLIGNDTKQNTVLTNAQIINILHKEFGIEVEKVNLLEIEIYINIIKKYLKDWPEWDKFEKEILNLESQKNRDDIKNIIEINYLALKDYLKSKLEVVKLLLPTYLNKLPQNEINERNVDKKTDGEKIVMEVCATKAQLNNLILRQPKQNNHIFNWEEPNGNCPNVPLKAIAHWGGINIHVKVSWSPTEILIFKYENRHISKYTLVNKKLSIQPNKPEHNVQWQIKCKNQNKVNISINDVLNTLGIPTKNGRYTGWHNIFQVLRNDLKILTEDMPSNINVPVEFKKHLSKYNYVRYMYKDVTDSNNSENYDLQLEEVITPICYLNIEIYKKKDKKEFDVTFECNICKMDFKTKYIEDALIEHFKIFHLEEPDWQCVNCNTIISPIELANLNWQHTCPSNNKKLLQALLM